MKVDRKQIGLRIKQALEEAKITQRELSKRLGISEPSVTAYTQGTSNLPAEAYVAISSLCGVSIDWLITGEEPTLKSKSSHSDEDSGAFVISETGVEYVSVPRFEVVASAGGGAIVESEQVVDYLMFSKDWVKSALGASPNNLALINVMGDSMSPSYNDGDLILVDTTVNQPKSDAVYVIQHDSCLWVKRLHFHFDGSIAVISDNPRYPEQNITGEALARLRIVGRVIWKGGR